ncbi:NAD(P)H-binding protein [Paracoccus pacificus]|uniref:NAD(P)H-binding protein n=1 Tax=Paracoccus pacificus TaxID=1463598 RepID=A0ABW4RBM3_9RHOB
MFVLIGGTGQVGSAAARALLAKGHKVTVITRNRTHGAGLEAAGARVAEVDIRDVAALRAVLQTGRRAFLLNPPADPSDDTDREERRNVAAIIAALDGSGLEKVVAQSTYGAFQGTACGDLTVLHEMEARLSAQPIPVAINRCGYYMSNWAAMADTVRHTGILPSFFPADLELPMVAPEDLGQAAAARLLSSCEDVGLCHVEGPERYTPRDVADTFAAALDRVVAVEEIPQPALEATFRSFGFSKPAAASYACMTRRLIDGQTKASTPPQRGRTSLAAYIRRLVAT